MRKHIVIIALIVFCFALISAGCGTSDVVDQVANVTNKSEPIVQMVKGGHPAAYPSVTYEDAFDSFFASPTWKYFVGTQEDSETEHDIVEFTGYCTYQDVEVKALVQFAVDVDNETFEASYLSFNEVPQSALTLGALIDTAFESYNNGSASSVDVSDSTSSYDNSAAPDATVTYDDSANYEDPDPKNQSSASQEQETSDWEQLQESRYDAMHAIYVGTWTAYQDEYYDYESDSLIAYPIDYSASITLDENGRGIYKDEWSSRSFSWESGSTMNGAAYGTWDEVEYEYDPVEFNMQMVGDNEIKVDFSTTDGEYYIYFRK